MIVILTDLIFAKVIHFKVVSAKILAIGTINFPVSKIYGLSILLSPRFVY